jgi:hypothetical protein
MTRQRSPKIRILGVSVVFIATLTVLIAFASPAQQALGTGQPSAKSSAVSVTVRASTPAQAFHPLLPGANDTERIAVSRMPTKRHDAHAMTPVNFLNFLPAVTYNSGGSYPASVAVADVNGDGKPDLLVANKGSGTVSVLLGNGDGTFQPAVSYGSGGSFTYSLALGDVNGDGKLDLVVANAGSNTVGVLLGHGDGTFATAVAYDSGGYFPDSGRHRGR